MTDYTDRFKEGMSSTPFERCRFNTAKGLWETHPAHWVALPDVRGSLWVAVGFALATQLERGVSA